MEPEPMTRTQQAISRRDFGRAKFLLPLICVIAPLFAAADVTAGERAVKRSEVVFMGRKDREIYEAYGATMVSWGGRPWKDDERAVAHFGKQVKVARDLGMRYCGGAAFRTSFRGMIDFDENWKDSHCLTIEGKPITVPWLWDQKHKDGHPAYWFCSNAPGYRKYLKWQVMTAMKVDVDGLHIDDYNGTAGTEYHGCCFCKNCMRMFGEYVKRNVSAERLKQCGVKSPEDFDYKAFLNGKGIKTVADYRRILNSAEHLGPEFVRFQYFTAADFVGETRRYAEQLADHRVLLSVNSSCSGPKSLVIAPQLSYFCGEVHHGAEKSPWGPQQNWDLTPVWTFKLADAIDRPQCCTGSGGDWAYIAEHKKPGLVRRWIAQDYAFGHCLMAPHRQWAYTKTKGTHHYQSTAEDFAHLYRFVRRNATLFDGYEAVAPVALLYSNAAARASHRHIQNMQHACLWLAAASVPFEIVMAGDEWLDARLSAEELARYKAVVMCSPTMFDGEQQKVVDELTAAGKVVGWDAKTGIEEAALRKLLPRQVTIAGSGKVIAVARAIPGKPNSPVVLHLLNRDYDEPSDTTKKLTGVEVTLDKSLFSGRSFSKATLYRPPAKFDPQAPGVSQPVSLEIRSVKGRTALTVPELDLWAIVKLER